MLTKRDDIDTLFEIALNEYNLSIESFHKLKAYASTLLGADGIMISLCFNAIFTVTAQRASVSAMRWYILHLSLGFFVAAFFIAFFFTILTELPTKFSVRGYRYLHLNVPMLLKAFYESEDIDVKEEVVKILSNVLTVNREVRRKHAETLTLSFAFIFLGLLLLIFSF